MNKINYALAKELKDNGFPQSYGEYKDGSFFGLDSVAIPTLSELIEACGEHFSSLTVSADKEGTFYANGGNMGSTPEEAVAKLFLYNQHGIY